LKDAGSDLIYLNNFRGWKLTEKHLLYNLARGINNKQGEKPADQGHMVEAASEGKKQIEGEKNHQKPSEDGEEEGMDAKEQEQLEWQNNRENELGKRRK
jgi:hypothetical protein